MTQLQYMRLEERFLEASGDVLPHSSRKDKRHLFLALGWTKIKNHMAPAVIRSHTMTLGTTRLRIKLICSRQNAETEEHGSFLILSFSINQT